ncbi:MAG: GLPGLI family protein [Polaribacter sp.]|nr:GLPGLI family protein [Polaribacter sp.]
MKNTVILVGMLFVSSVFGQNFQGKAIYKTHRKMDLKIDASGNSGMSDAMKEQMTERMKKMFQKTFTLSFNKSESVYKENKKLAGPSSGPKKVMVSMVVVGSGGGSDVYYKDVKENRFINKTEIMGKRFLIKDKLPTYDWKLTGETKNIGVYTCYKATYTRQEERTKIDVVDGEVKEEKEKVDVVTTAWYAPAIAVSNGPSNYGGLPGLILEINEGKLTIVCTEIIMNPTEKMEIKKPKKGKVVTQVAYKKIMDKKAKEMMEKFRTRKGKKGDGISIEIGG